MREALRALDPVVAAVPGPGNFVADVGVPRTRGGTPFTVFTPFMRAWERLERRPVHRAPSELPPLPGRVRKERMRALEWQDDDELLAAWQDGRTGYPLVDAAMRQLRACGWMHNRARLVVGSFLTKDLQLDWRAGEAWFMRWLLDGDVASNNGNWQWIASVGVDPAPAFRRILNPTLQQRRHDPDGAYVRRWVPELRDVPGERLAEPWTMSDEEQRAAGCAIGVDYPAPVVEHRAERERALARYRATAGGPGAGSIDA